MGRTPLIAGNWKLNLGPSEARALTAAIVNGCHNRGKVEVALFPTALAVTAVLESAEGSGISIGLQNIHHHQVGAFTGENSAEMARTIGCTRALIGHSERRNLFGETDEDTGLKVQAARHAGLLPVLCVGETLEERNSGKAMNVVERQLFAGLSKLEPDQLSGLVIAYEPVWAIGTGLVATPEQAQEMHAFIREKLNHQIFPSFASAETRILYGGSVKPTNAASLLACPDIDGALVGGASLKADTFTAIIEAAAAQ